MRTLPGNPPRGFLWRDREPSPVAPRVFVSGPREDTKPAGPSMPRIDLTKPARGIPSPIRPDRRALFQIARETMKYTEIPGSRPRELFRREAAPRDTMGNLIPNRDRLFAQPREVMKCPDVWNPAPVAREPRDLFWVCEKEDRRLFRQPRTWVKLAESPGRRGGRQRVQGEAAEEEPPRRLFREPRQVMKYGDVEGSHPTRVLPASPRRPSPTFASTIFQ
jgi:hypothetical protein